MTPTAPKKLTIAIDGYSSCGKSTFAKAIAAMLGYAFIDTGAMYRAVTLWALNNNALNNPEFICQNLDNINISFRFNPTLGRSEIFLNNQNVDTQIRTMQVNNSVSAIAQITAVRTKLVAMQQDMGQQGGIVMDGRDIGTVVFPAAEIKIFMTASVDIRADRRCKELIEKGGHVSLEEIKKNVADRDFQDENRTESPLRKADNTILLDNSTMTVEEQMNWIRNILKPFNVI